MFLYLLDFAQTKEYILHVFRDCWRARTIWERLVDQDKWVGFSQGSSENWKGFIWGREKFVSPPWVWWWSWRRWWVWWWRWRWARWWSWIWWGGWRWSCIHNLLLQSVWWTLILSCHCISMHAIGLTGWYRKWWWTSPSCFGRFLLLDCLNMNLLWFRKIYKKIDISFLGFFQFSSFALSRSLSGTLCIFMFI